MWGPSISSVSFSAGVRKPSVWRGRTRRNTTVNFTGDTAGGALVDVQIESATSTTLRGTARALVAA